MIRKPLVVLPALFALVFCTPYFGAADDQSEAFFEKEIRPVLAAKCLKCHGPKKQESKLRVDSLAALLKGGENGPALKPGKPEDSPLLAAIRHDGLEMPPEEKLPDSVIAAFERWIRTGAKWPENAVVRADAHVITEDDRAWWAFQPLPNDPQPPRLAHDKWSANGIDRFIFAALQEREMAPAPPATKEKLVRRLYFDLIGLPPTPAEIDAFLNDESPQAWSQLIDRLLDDPRYGEHWSRFWLDLARYTESDGWNQDAYRPHIWRYRDYVVASFNADKPYPQFVREQLAGDERPNDPVGLTAAGFLRLGIYEYNQRDARGHWNDIMNDMTDVVADVFLGMSVACARCHSHKFDPIPQADYFKLRAFFEPVVWRDDLVAATDEQQAEYRQKQEAWLAATADIRQQIDAIKQPYNDRKWESTVEKFPLEIQACFNKPEAERNSWEQQMAYLVSRQFLEEGGGPLKGIKKEHKAKLDELDKQLAEFDHLKPKPLPPLMTATTHAGLPAPTQIPDGPDNSIAPGFLSVLSHVSIATDQSASRTQNGGPRRAELAEWIGNKNNPLTTRVIVNRVWQQHFGRALADTPNDLGRQGQQATHPALLDWLTVKFLEDGWSIKSLHRRILHSNTWLQSSRHADAARQEKLDPTGQWLWRAPVRRLKAEQIRDALLLVSGELDPQVGGPSVEDKAPRRSVYVKRFRNKTETFLHTFDAAPGLKSVANRATTTTPTQSLLMINGDYSLARAGKLADRLLAAENSNAFNAVTAAVRSCWGRAPSEEEMSIALRFLHVEQPTASVDRAKLVDFCHVLFNSNEFLYVD